MVIEAVRLVATGQDPDRRQDAEVRLREGRVIHQAPLDDEGLLPRELAEVIQQLGLVEARRSVA